LEVEVQQFRSQLGLPGEVRSKHLLRLVEATVLTYYAAALVVWGAGSWEDERRVEAVELGARLFVLDSDAVHGPMGARRRVGAIHFWENGFVDFEPAV
jgi:hypothetical protein